MFDTRLYTWQQYLAGPQAAPQLAHPFTDAMTPFLAFLQEQGVTAPAGITPDLVATWRKALQHGEAVPQSGGLVPSMQFFAVRCFLRYLERGGDVQNDPAAHLAPLPVSVRETAQELTVLEAQALLLAPDLATDDRSSFVRSLGWRDRTALVANAARQAGLPKRISPTTVTRSGVEERRQRALRALRAKGLDVGSHAERDQRVQMYARLVPRQPEAS